MDELPLADELKSFARSAVSAVEGALLIAVQIRLAKALRKTGLVSSRSLLFKVIIPIAFVNVLLTATIAIAQRSGW